MVQDFNAGLRIVGCGDAFGSGGRLQSAYLLDMAKERLLVDCGVSTLIGLKRAAICGNSIPAVLVSHLHGDHFGGLPFLILDAIYEARRTLPLTLIGPAGLESRLRLLCETMYTGMLGQPLPFPLRFIEFSGLLPLEFGQLLIAPHLMQHPSGAPSHGYRIAAGGKVFAFSGDTGWTDALLPLADGSDLLLLECNLRTGTLPMHLSWEAEVRPALPRLGARKVVLTHLGPDMLDADVAPATLAHDGLIVEF